MIDPLEQQNETEEEVKVKRVSKKHVFRLPDGQIVPTSEFKSISKFDKDTIIYCHGEEENSVPAEGKKKARTDYVTAYDPSQPWPVNPINPGFNSPICKQCSLHENDSKNPFMPYAGSENPLVTIIMDSVGRGEDVNGVLGSTGGASNIRRIIEESSKETGVTLDDIRWVPMTRCANWLKKTVNLKPKGNWCRHHVIDDIMRHPPALLMPVGTTALGLLSHKSNAQEWTGRLLTYRGWPDDWLTNPKYSLPRINTEGTLITGHPLFGGVPDWKIPMIPIQAPKLIFKENNRVITDRWAASIVKALKLAKKGVKALNYTRSWYVFTDDVELIEKTLKELLLYPGIKLTYDTETTGLRPLADDAAIVSMMFRWTDPKTKFPRAIGFPWYYKPTDEHPDYEESPLLPHIGRLKMLIWKVLTQSTLIGHNLTFDMLYTYGFFWRKHLVGWNDTEFNKRRDGWLCKLADACRYDTWHMAFAWQQKRGSLGLEAIAYDWVPEFAGYEEDMTLMIDLNYDRMHPKAGKGGHYLNCPRDKWKSHVVPYVMGDVEVCYKAYSKIKAKLESSHDYFIPLADPARKGGFRWFNPPDRNWVYHEVISPAASVLMKMMARGLHIDTNALKLMEDKMPNEIIELRKTVETVDPRIQGWCDQNKAEDKTWELDLENKSQLKSILFECLNLPVMRFTKLGKKLLGEDVAKATQSMSAVVMSQNPELKDDAKALEEAVQVQLREVAAIDKFTLNKICSDFEHLRPLQKYKRAFKIYSTYVRPVRNFFTENLDKKRRTADPHLCFDNCIHASFLLTGTRSGRLSSKAPNLQQLPREGVIKSMFTSRFGERGCMYAADLSQIELRLMACACGDPVMVKAYFEGQDLHSLTASRIFKIPYDNFSKSHMKDLQAKGYVKEAKELDEKRTLAKTTNFLTGYGGGAFGLQNVLAMRDMNLKIEECQEIVEKFFEAYPALKTWIQKYKRFILDKHVAVSIFGRVRVFEEVLGNDEEAKAKAQRAGVNHAIQATASDMMLIALFTIESRMRQENLESILVSTVHDSLLIDCVKTELPIMHEIAMDVLSHFPDVFKSLFGDDYDTSWMITPFDGDAEVGSSYHSAFKLSQSDVDWDAVYAKLKA